MSTKDKNNIIEGYGRLETDDRSFDQKFWQQKGLKAIFDAAYDMIQDYFLLKENYANKPRIQRSIESFGKTPM